MKYKLREVAGKRFICKVNVLSNVDEPKLFDTYNEAYQHAYSWNTNSSIDKVEMLDENNNRVLAVNDAVAWKRK